VIRDRLIICIASAWDGDPTSKHHIMKILARHNDVLWVNYHGTRRPTLNRVDVRGALETLGRVMRGVERISDSMWQVTPLVIPGARRTWVDRASQFFLARQIHRAIKTIRRSPQRPVQVWSFAPDVPDLVGCFGEECFVYYCVDAFNEFLGVDADRVTRAETRTLDRADVVFTTSRALQESRSLQRPDAVLMRHGVDFDHFASAWQATPPVPHELRAIPRPVFGFFGLIEHWIDIELLAEVATLRPTYSFVLIGSTRVDVSALRALPNVHLLGRRPYAELPAYAASFDAALMPFTRTSMTRNVNPIKMHEYLAAGLRVVSTSLPEARRYAGRILIADTSHEFAVACDRALSEAEEYPPDFVAQSVMAETWASRVEQLSTVVMQQVRHRGQPATCEACDVLATRPARRNDDSCASRGAPGACLTADG